ncbi:hypothetical protein [Paenibacillus sp. LPE1-1-1.1]|uniref:hypothetical protein n=1 Tax=Paenibacillus sp. LPE1-1-1.1 TaxID=3135230 RepID=UPI0034406E0F
MYNLYASKDEGKLEVKLLRKVFYNLKDTITDEVTQYNGVYYFCSKRKPLVVYAEQLKQEWLREVEDELNRIKSIVIK